MCVGFWILPSICKLSGYQASDWIIQSSIPGRCKRLVPSPNIRSGSEVHPVSCKKTTGVFPARKTLNTLSLITRLQLVG